MKVRAILFIAFNSFFVLYASSSVDEDFNNITSASERLKRDVMKLKCRFQDIRDDGEKIAYRVSVLKQYLADVDTYFRNDNLEILGVPEVKGENLLAILRNISTVIEVPFSEVDISIVWRNHELFRNNFTPEGDSIIVRFVSRTMRNKWLKMGRDRIVIYSKGCLPELPESEIYINEHLSKEKKGLVKTAKLLEKNRKIPFAWVKDGHLYIRRTPTGQSIKIRSLHDLKILGYIE